MKIISVNIDFDYSGDLTKSELRLIVKNFLKNLEGVDKKKTNISILEEEIDEIIEAKIE